MLRYYLFNFWHFKRIFFIYEYFDILNKDLVKNSPNSYIKDKSIASYIYSDNNQEFIQDYIKFNDYSSTFNLRYILKNKIDHFCTIHMIDLPEMYPENATIYLREDNIFPLNVIKGSGDFNIELSDDSLASYNYDKNSRKIYLKPLKQGILTLKLKDNQLGSSYNYEVKSKIYISDVKKILLYCGGLLMNNKTTNLDIEISGGPQNKENAIIKYEISDEKIAKFTENYPEVYAKTYGETILKITLLYKYDYNKFFNINDDKKIINRTDTLCIENVSVRVDFPDNVEILGGQDNRKIYAKSTIRLLAGLKKKMNYSHMELVLLNLIGM